MRSTPDQTRRRRGRLAGLLALLVTALLVASGCATGDDAVAQGDTFQFVSPGGKTLITYDLADRKPIGVVEGEDLASGAHISINDPRFAGKVVVVNLWAHWCAPCRAEADDLEAVYAKYRGQGAEFLGINFRDDKDSARDFIGDRQITYPSIYDYPGANLRPLGIPAPVVPTTVVLDRQHRPAVVFIKSVDATELGAQVAAVLAEGAPSGARR